MKTQSLFYVEGLNNDVSCAVNAETRALGQISNCLEYYITKLFPDHKTTWVRFEGKLDIDQLDFEEEEEEQEEKKEEDMTKEKERKEKKFQAIDAACGGLVFYRFRVNVKPTEFIIKLMDYIKQLPDKEREQELAKVRHCSRWIPFDYICPATTERIKSCFERVKEDHFMNTCTTSITVAIITDIRNNILITKDEIIQTIAPLIPPNYKVNLSKPTLVIYVSVFKSVCGITVLKEYFERKKYNLISYCCQQKK
ncbi:uncharacterized protein BX663DRAFT_529706 [Cokeromyces recurvatus]|uniref:uncharacterized protein n=1 Tax=Cokeromyces recurvatus TaxID=90255 RepID=UPI0022211872|nr:uncharacterized protein BX663DRAFT_529706 [Cokeromyces recurvatus]KAI7905509.1 hypothetical protein BX663DRAFT_529706 [Cokeromyces recurvatus]